MKKYFILIAGVLSACVFNACNTPEIHITAATVLLDVRTQPEYNARHIPGSILIPHKEIAKQIKAKVPGKDTPIALFCRSGRRSAIAANELKSLGYKQVQDLGSIDNAAKVLGVKIRKK